MYKRFLLLVLSAILLFLFSSCNTPDVNEVASSSEEENWVSSEPECIENKIEQKGPTVLPMLSNEDYFASGTYCDPITHEKVYYLFHEPARENDEKRPLIIFLHGRGDTVNMYSLGTSTPFVNSLMQLENQSEKYGAYTLVPSTPLAEELDWSFSQLETFKKLIFYIKENYNVDEKRIYVTGISMGGFTTCKLVDQMPDDFFAAAVPLSGAKSMLYPEITHNTAFRIYHSANDMVVNVSCSRNLYEQLVQSGHPKVEYIEFEDGDHISPLYSVYVEGRDSFFEWLFAQKLP